MTRRAGIGSTSLLVAVLIIAASLGGWKYNTLQTAEAAAAVQPEPVEAVSATTAEARRYRPTNTSIGTVQALRSISLRNELPGTVTRVALEPGTIVDAGTVLVALDVAVETAELKALQAEAALSESVLARSRRLLQQDAISQEQLDRAVADRDINLAQIARIQAVIERKTVRAPFRARVGIADIHPGQYLNEGTQITTLQGVDAAAHIDFSVEQRAAAGLQAGDIVEVIVNDGLATIDARVVAVDAKVNPDTRNAVVRARIENAAAAPPPGASVRVRFASGTFRQVVSVPSSAVRKGPAGDHVFVLTTGDDGQLRAQNRPITVVAQLGDETVIGSGLRDGEQVATSGSFKLRENVLVALAGLPQGSGGGL